MPFFDSLDGDKDNPSPLSFSLQRADQIAFICLQVDLQYICTAQYIPAILFLVFQVTRYSGY